MEFPKRPCSTEEPLRDSEEDDFKICMTTLKKLKDVLNSYVKDGYVVSPALPQATCDEVLATSQQPSDEHSSSNKSPSDVFSPISPTATDDDPFKSPQPLDEHSSTNKSPTDVFAPISPAATEEDCSISQIPMDVDTSSSHKISDEASQSNVPMDEDRSLSNQPMEEDKSLSNKPMEEDKSISNKALDEDSIISELSFDEVPIRFQTSVDASSPSLPKVTELQDVASGVSVRPEEFYPDFAIGTLKLAIKLLKDYLKTYFPHQSSAQGSIAKDLPKSQEGLSTSPSTGEDLPKSQEASNSSQAPEKDESKSTSPAPEHLRKLVQDILKKDDLAYLPWENCDPANPSSSVSSHLGLSKELSAEEKQKARLEMIQNIIETHRSSIMAILKLTTHRGQSDSALRVEADTPSPYFSDVDSYMAYYSHIFGSCLPSVCDQATSKSPSIINHATRSGHLRKRARPSSDS